MILVNGLILSDPDHPEVLPHGKTEIIGNRLGSVNLPNDLPTGWDGVIDCSNCLLMPGLINCHTHAAMSLLRGLADDLNLDRWLNDYIFPAEAQHVDSRFVYLGTMLSAVEMALNGITTFADGYFHMEMAAQASIEVGLRAVIGQGILDVPTPDASVSGSWKERAGRFLASCPDDPLITPAFFCHSPYLCRPETLRAAAELARNNGLLIFSHVSETTWEVSEIKSRYRSGPVAHLDGLGVLGEDFVAVHAIHVSDQEQEMLCKSGTKVVHCPESNMKLASGAAPIQDMIRRGVTIGIGTDGPASNNNLDLFEEMRSASFMAKLRSNDPEALNARTVLRMATSSGARVLGMADRIGSLEPGKLADVIVVDLNRPHLFPMYDPISDLVYAGRGSDVRDVIVNGKFVVRSGRLTTVDEEQLKTWVWAKASEISEGLNLKSYGNH